MIKKLLLTIFLLLNLIGIIYPTKKENTRLFDYCYALEKILSNNSIQTEKSVSEVIQSISQNIIKFGVSQTRGDLVNKIIVQYKNSKNSFIINLVPNRIYCYAGYWAEKVNPGFFESIFFSESKKTINEFRDLKDDIDELLNDINSEFKVIEDEFNILF
tara:strand:- start:114 stop:590 length:477 start_codon:yes stop_codon:yes gene_type:complete